ncbi:Transposon Ty3-G Gag-Pol polyprotein [Labeo rohita]|uniref:ribonuclease H n=1 Tax=Labeo rohita TaxID=84645 RepID=A0ABQ8MMQ5_LABRO|nr:Transposon Ty3-G Gag-Pol polyprotein [Labeo rohita]
MVNRFVFVYLDDILIFSQNKHDHVQHISQVLQCLLENRLIARMKKCEFHAWSVPFLGFVVSPDGDSFRTLVKSPLPLTDLTSTRKRIGFTTFGKDALLRIFEVEASPILPVAILPPERVVAAGLFHPLTVPAQPWSHIVMDFITGLPLSRGKTVVLTVVDRFSKAVHFFPLLKLPSARETAAVVLDHVFRIHGLPVNVVSDKDPRFVSRFWTEFCQQLGATASLSSGYHPQTNGQAERANKDLERVLASTEPSSWSSRLTMELTITPSRSRVLAANHHYSPPKSLTLLFHTRKHLFRDASALGGSPEKPLLGLVIRTRHQRTVTVPSPYRHRTKPPLYVYGQKVWLSSQDLHFRLPSRKLGPKFVGPFTVSKVLSPVPNPPPPRLVEGSQAYMVRQLINVRRGGRDHQYLVDWEGYGPEERCWVLINQFHRCHGESSGDARRCP